MWYYCIDQRDWNKFRNDRSWMSKDIIRALRALRPIPLNKWDNTVWLTAMEEPTERKGLIIPARSVRTFGSNLVMAQAAEGVGKMLQVVKGSRNRIPVQEHHDQDPSPNQSFDEAKGEMTTIAVNEKSKSNKERDIQVKRIRSK